MAQILKDTEQVPVTASFVDAKNNPALVEGAPVWGVSDPTILSVEAAADGMSATIKALGPLGPCQVNCTGDADLGAGVTPVVLIGDVEVVAGQAVAGTISFGTPTAQP